MRIEASSPFGRACAQFAALLLVGTVGLADWLSVPQRVDAVRTLAAPGTPCPTMGAATRAHLTKLGLPVPDQCAQLPRGWSARDLCQSDSTLTILFDNSSPSRGGATRIGSCPVVVVNPRKWNSLTVPHEMLHVRLGHLALNVDAIAAKFVLNVVLDVQVDAEIHFGAGNGRLALTAGFLAIVALLMHGRRRPPPSAVSIVPETSRESL